MVGTATQPALADLPVYGASSTQQLVVEAAQALDTAYRALDALDTQAIRAQLPREIDVIEWRNLVSAVLAHKGTFERLGAALLAAQDGGAK